ncbi:MAG: hypothetical protein ACHQ1H_00645 [Nitrososphaerales archaeon]
METDTAVVIRYWISSDDPIDFPDLDGIEEFRNALSDDYLTVVRGRPSGAGGLVHLTAELISSFPLSHIVQLLLDGIAYDLIKEGSRSFILRPFIAAYHRLRDKNKERLLEIAELKIEFADCQISVHEVSRDTVIDNIERILHFLAYNYGRLALPSGELPYEIHVPVVEDPDTECATKFRILANIEETITGCPDDYFRYWGIAYGYPWERRVYDVREKRLLNESFSTVQEYWQHLARRK